MSVMYRKYQNKNVKNQKCFGKWYARAVTVATMSTDQVSEKIEANCSMKRADVLAVLSEMAVVIKDALNDSKRVVIDGLGAFKPTLHTTPAETSKDFSAGKNVKSIGILFQPQTIVTSDGKHVKKLMEYANATELPKNFIVDKTDEEDGEQGGEG